MSDIQSFQALISTITDAIGNRTLDKGLQQGLNEQFPYDGDVAQAIRQTCAQGMAQGWMGRHEHRGLRYGRVIEPCTPLNGYSVDVVDMNDIAGPHHRHPGGEIDHAPKRKPRRSWRGQARPYQCGAKGAPALWRRSSGHKAGVLHFIMPVDPLARFDGQGAGWLVYGPDSAHSPTVTQGRALILYLLPRGEIEFTRR